MDTREKLIELLRYVQYLGGLEEKIADHLIANGVTVQEWISVKDRLPERYTRILLWAEMDGDISMGVLDDRREWYVPGYENKPFNATHWMPLPQPPKGE